MIGSVKIYYHTGLPVTMHNVEEKTRERMEVKALHAAHKDGSSKGRVFKKATVIDIEV